MNPKAYLVILDGRPRKVVDTLAMVNDYISKHPEATYREYSCPSEARTELYEWIVDNRMEFQFDDGGRSAAGFTGRTGDCAVRSIAIVTGQSYQEVYDGINVLAEREGPCIRNRPKSNAETGVRPDTMERYLHSAGYWFVPTKRKGRRCRVHLRNGELPDGRLAVLVSRHLTAVIDGVIHYTRDCGRDATRCVYGYFIKR